MEEVTTSEIEANAGNDIDPENSSISSSDTSIRLQNNSCLIMFALKHPYRLYNRVLPG